MSFETTAVATFSLRYTGLASIVYRLCDENHYLDIKVLLLSIDAVR